MSNNLQKIWRAEVAKMRRCEAAGRVSENRESRRSEDPKMRSCGEGFRKSGEPKIRRSEDAKLRRGFHKIWKGGDKYNSLFKEICYTKMPTKYLPIQCHEDPKIRRSEDARQEQCPPSATCLQVLDIGSSAGYLNIYESF